MGCVSAAERYCGVYVLPSPYWGLNICTRVDDWVSSWCISSGLSSLWKWNTLLVIIMKPLNYFVGGIAMVCCLNWGIISNFEPPLILTLHQVLCSDEKKLIFYLYNQKLLAIEFWANEMMCYFDDFYLISFLWCCDEANRLMVIASTLHVSIFQKPIGLQSLLQLWITSWYKNHLDKPTIPICGRELWFHLPHLSSGNIRYSASGHQSCISWKITSRVSKNIYEWACRLHLSKWMSSQFSSFS